MNLKTWNNLKAKPVLVFKNFTFLILLFSLLCSCFLCTEGNRHQLNNRVFSGLIVHLHVEISIMSVQSLRCNAYPSHQKASVPKWQVYGPHEGCPNGTRLDLSSHITLSDVSYVIWTAQRTLALVPNRLADVLLYPGQNVTVVS